MQTTTRTDSDHCVTCHWTIRLMEDAPIKAPASLIATHLPFREEFETQEDLNRAARSFLESAKERAKARRRLIVWKLIALAALVGLLLSLGRP